MTREREREKREREREREREIVKTKNALGYDKFKYRLYTLPQRTGTDTETKCECKQAYAAHTHSHGQAIELNRLLCVENSTGLYTCIEKGGSDCQGMWVTPPLAKVKLSVTQAESNTDYTCTPNPGKKRKR